MYKMDNVILLSKHKTNIKIISSKFKRVGGKK